MNLPNAREVSAKAWVDASTIALIVSLRTWAHCRRFTARRTLSEDYDRDSEDK
jgi:hypothetical protein